MIRKVKFLEDFATKKKGEVWETSATLASRLVNLEKVAEYVTDKPKKEK